MPSNGGHSAAGTRASASSVGARSSSRAIARSTRGSMPGPATNERNAQAGVVHARAVLVVEAVLAEVLAVIGGEHHVGVGEQPARLERVEQAAHVKVGERDLGVVERLAVGERGARLAAEIDAHVRRRHQVAARSRHQIAAGADPPVDRATTPAARTGSEDRCSGPRAGTARRGSASWARPPGASRRATRSSRRSRPPRCDRRSSGSRGSDRSRGAGSARARRRRSRSRRAWCSRGRRGSTGEWRAWPSSADPPRASRGARAGAPSSSTPTLAWCGGTAWSPHRTARRDGPARRSPASARRRARRRRGDRLAACRW